MQVFGNTGALLIETDERGIGLAIHEGERFRFVALDPRYDSLDGQLFRSPEEIERTVNRGDKGKQASRQHPPAQAA